MLKKSNKSINDIAEKVNISLSKTAKVIIDKLQENNFKAYIVGGCVRDYFMNRPCHDIDITTNATPQQVIGVFSDYTVIPTGIKHGTVTIVIDSENVEVTTFRIDGKYQGNRKPEQVEFSTDLKEDLTRRDFTINAMAYNNQDGLVDLFGGEEDIKNKVIRAVGNPDKRFTEDALRILRAIRFSSVLGFEIEENTKKSILKNKHLIKNISVERSFIEIKKLLCGDNVKQVLEEYDEVIFELIPELTLIKNFNQFTDYHVYDIWKHSITTVSNIENDEVLRLSAMLHDIGKPPTFTIDEQGKGRFYGHSEKSVDVARKILNRFKVDNKTKNRVLTLIKYHNSIIEVNEKHIRKWISKIGKDMFFDLMKLRYADKLEENLEFWEAKEKLDKIMTIANKIIDEKQCTELKSLDVNGSDLLNIEIPTYKIGKILQDVLEQVMADKLKNNKQDIICYVKNTYTKKTKYR